MTRESRFDLTMMLLAICAVALLGGLLGGWLGSRYSPPIVVRVPTPVATITVREWPAKTPTPTPTPARTTPTPSKTTVKR